MKRQLRIVCALVALSVALSVSLVEAQETSNLVLPVPQRSQIDGTVWAFSNCGPASLGMVLEAFGDKTSNTTLRERANQLLGISDPSTGTRIEDLARIAREHGLSTTGPEGGKKLRRWSLDDTRAELQEGHPLVIQTYFPLLPNQRNNPVDTDHYVVLVGLEGNSFIFNDPAKSGNAGYHQKMTEDELVRAWGASSCPFAGFSVAAGIVGEPLISPPTPTPLPTETPTPTLTSTPSPTVTVTLTPTDAANPVPTDMVSPTPSATPTDAASPTPAGVTTTAPANETALAPASAATASTSTPPVSGVAASAASPTASSRDAVAVEASSPVAVELKPAQEAPTPSPTATASPSATPTPTPTVTVSPDSIPSTLPANAQNAVLDAIRSLLRGGAPNDRLLTPTNR